MPDSQARAAMLSEVINDSGICSVEVDSIGNVVAVNQPTLHLLGYSFDEMLGQPFWNFIRETDRELYRVSTIEKIVGKRKPDRTHLVTLCRMDGSPTPVLLDDYLVGGESDVALLTTLRDASVGSEFAHALEEETLFSARLAGLPVFVHRKDAEGRFTYIDPEYCQQRGLDPNWVLGRTDFDLYLPELAEKYRKDDLNVLRSGRAWETIEGHQTSGENPIDVVHVVKIPEFDADGKAIGLLIAFWKAEDRQTILARLMRLQEQLHRSVVDNIPFYLYRKNTTLQFIYVSDQYCRHIGRERHELLGRTDQDIFPKVLADKYETDDRFVIESRQSFQGDEDHIIGDGTHQTVRVVKTPTFDDAGNVIGIQGVFWDVTAEKRAAELEKEREQHEARARAQQDVATEIHHRIKNSLFAVILFLKRKLRFIQQGDARTAIQDSIARLQTIASLHEQLYREDTTQIRADEYLGEISKSFLDAYLEEGRKIDLSINVEPILFPADMAHSCGLIVAELVSNALKHAFPDERDGGAISVSLAPLNDDVMELSVSDNGIGVQAPDDLEASESHGMRLVEGFAERLRGRVTKHSSLQGTQVRILFPAVAAATEESSQVVRVLVVDDEPEIAEGLRDDLMDCGYEVPGFALNASQALALAESYRFDVAIVDVSLSRKEDGIALADMLRTAYAISIIFVTGGGPEIEKKARASGPVEVLRKPVDGSALRAAVHLAITSEK